MPIPEVLEESDTYEITIEKTTQTIAGEEIEIWGYNGVTPSPMIRHPKSTSARETTSVVRFNNTLAETSTVVHLHGMASAPEYDGFADDAIPTNYYKDYYYPNDRAATIWYHDHLAHQTQGNVGMGLLGMYVVYDEELENELQLPGYSGDDSKYDVPLILQGHPDSSSPHKNCVLVNGECQPYLDVDRRKYRFRLLNATATSRFTTQLSQGQFTLIASDGGLRQAPLRDITSFSFIPGERYEIVVDFNQFGEDVTEVYLATGSTGSSQVLCFNIGTDLIVDPSQVPGELSPDRDPPSREDAAITREFIFDNDRSSSEGPWAINSKVWGDGWETRLVANPPSGNIEIWKFINNSTSTHPVHVHLIDMYLLTRDDDEGNVLSQEQSWKDVFNLGGGETLEVIGTFMPHQGRYVMHCHNLAHEDNDMMVEFQVGDDDTDPSTIAPAQPITGARSLQNVPVRGIYNQDAIRDYKIRVYGRE